MGTTGAKTSDEITHKRLELWKEKLSAHQATPQLLISVGVDQGNESFGKVIINTTKDREVKEIKMLLVAALDLLEKDKLKTDGD